MDKQQRLAFSFSLDLRKSIEICPPTPNSGGARNQSPPELGDLGGECVSPISLVFSLVLGKLDYWGWAALPVGIVARIANLTPLTWRS